MFDGKVGGVACAYDACGRISAKKVFSSIKTGLLNPNRSIDRAISLICRGECVRAFLGLVDRSSILVKMIFVSKDGFSARSDFCINVCRNGERGGRSQARFLDQQAFSLGIGDKTSGQKSTILSL